MPTKLPLPKSDGDDDDEITLHPYAPNFGVKLRFSRVIGEVDQVKFVAQDPSVVVPRCQNDRNLTGVF